MAGLRFYTRRSRILNSTTPVQVFLIFLLMFLAVRFVVLHSHNSDQFPPRVVPGPVTTVDDPAIDWFKFAYVQHVTSPEYLCSALMLWSQVETIGSHAQRLMLYILPIGLMRKSMINFPPSPLRPLPDY